MISICAQRQRLLDCDGHALVLGGPGSGKTTVAMKKALLRIGRGLRPGQAVLFLSFSRAAIARLAEASRLTAPPDHRALLSMQTFHSFCWDILRPNAYLLGAPKRLTLLLPQDERVLNGGILESDPQWTAWLTERERLFQHEGRIGFDLFAPKAAQLLERCHHVRRLVTQRYPLIIVDEAQDTSEHAWRCVELLAFRSQLICLADLEQQIFDYLPGVGPQRIEAIRTCLTPVEVDLGSENHRSAGTQILTFGNDIATGIVRGTPYQGVSRLAYHPKNHDWASTLRKTLAILGKRIEERTEQRAKTVAILVPNNTSALMISTALNVVNPKTGKSIRHKLIFDEAEALLAARFAAFLLEPKREEDALHDLARAHEFIADMKKASGKGKSKVATLQLHATRIRLGKIPNSDLGKALRDVMSAIYSTKLSGDPAQDWTLIRSSLWQSGQADLRQIAGHLDYLALFKRGQRIRANLSAEWLRGGCYTNARRALDAALAQDQLLEGQEEPWGVQVMTFHKSKAKQFDGVIIVREGRRSGEKTFLSSFLWRDDQPPYKRSRRILRVAITRAKTHVLILDPHYPKCPILDGHKLQG